MLLLMKTEKRGRRVGKVPAKVEMQRCRYQEKTKGQRPARLSRIISLSVKRYPGHHHFLFFKLSLRAGGGNGSEPAIERC